MWLYCRSGFFSVVQHKNAPNLLLVRARVKEDLDDLRERYLPALGKTITTESADYPYRAVATKKHFSKAMVRISYDIDYTNFKTMTAQELGYDRASVYHKVHSATLAIDDRPDSHWTKGGWQTPSSKSWTPSSEKTSYASASPYKAEPVKNFSFSHDAGQIVTRIDPVTGVKTITRFPKGGGKKIVTVIKPEVRKPGDESIIEYELDADGKQVMVETDANGKPIRAEEIHEVDESGRDDSRYDMYWDALRDRYPNA